MEVIADGKLNIRSVQDLKAYAASGKKKLRLASLQGDTLELILTRILKQNQIPTDSVEIVNFDDLLAMVDAFRSGQVDILSHIKPYTTDFVVNKGATLITDEAKVWSPTTPNTVVSVLEKTLSGRPQIVKSYLQGLLCASDIINHEPQKAVSLITKGSYYRVSAETLLTAFKSAALPVSFVPDVDAIQSVIDDLSALGYVKGSTKASDIFRLDMIKTLQAEHDKK
jgi:ABC-type nitrate/sulfonate/bicarbonate transport system substrate-binding protein